MRRISKLALIATFIFGLVTPFAMGATVKAGATCTKLNQTQIVGSVKFTCIKSGKKLVWNSGVQIAAPKPSPTPSPSQSQSPLPNPSPSQSPSPSPSASSQKPVVVTEGWMCDKSGPSQASDSSGKVLYCVAGSDGVFSWRPSNQSNNNSNPTQGSSASPYSLGMLGSACASEGKVAWNGLVVAICKNGKVKYAISSDFPKSATGFSSRPDWYPELSEINVPGSQKPTCSSSSIVFTKSFVPIDQIAPSIPYGLMVGDHVTPIDHAYIGLKSLSKTPSSRTEADYVNVVAPADGTIIQLGGLGSPTSHRVVIDHGCGVYTVYMVLNKFSGGIASYQAQVDAGQVLSLKIPIKAGEVFGLQRDNPLDFNVWDGSKWLDGFVSPASYLTGDTWKPYTADYLPFFAPDIRSALEAQLQRTTAPRVGKIDYDTMGGAAGNWYLDGYFGYSCVANSVYQNATSVFFGDPDKSKTMYAWCHLAVAPHQVDPSAWIFSVGWWKDASGDPMQAIISTSSGQVTPDKLTSNSGVVVYKLMQISLNEPAGSPARVDGSGAPYAVGYKVSAGAQIGSVAIQIRSDGALAISISTDGTTLSGLSSNPRIYTR
mgnify:CR=1 FL=1